MVGHFITGQLLDKPANTPSGIDLTGRVAIITGGSSGLGLGAARHLLALGLSHVILAVRSAERGKDAAAELQKSYPKAKVDVWALEMESYESIQRFAEKCQSDLSRLDMAILNAGISEQDFKTISSTGHEKTMQINYQSTMLLAILLLPVLKSKSPPGTPGRLTVVNSATSSFFPFKNRNERPLLASFDGAANNTPYNGGERYGISKLLGQVFLDRLAEQVSPEHVTINMVEPGLTKGTSLFRNLHGIAKIAFGIFSTLGRSVDQGALTYVDAAVVKGTDSHGCYIVNCKIAG